MNTKRTHIFQRAMRAREIMTTVQGFAETSGIAQKLVKSISMECRFRSVLT